VDNFWAISKIESLDISSWLIIQLKNVNHLEGGIGENKVVYLFEQKNFYSLWSLQKRVLILKSGVLTPFLFLNPVVKV
jgi:hypothetical protein